MTDSPAPSPETTPPPHPVGARAPRSRWQARTIVAAVAALVLIGGYLIASVTVPLFWANAIRDQVGGQLGNSIPLGMFYGFMFSFVPVVVAWPAHHKKLNNWVRLSVLVLAVLLTVPNLLTLAVLYGTTTSAVNARSIWANDANWFGTWSQIFMVAGVGAAVLVIVLGRAWLRRGRKIRQIRAAERLVRENEDAKARAAKAAGRRADRRARDDARAAAKTARDAGRAARHRPSGPPDGPPAGSAAPAPPQA
ncbi:hypothetical protein [Specibacter sp. RAF43]|uniref:hypothetical protein n=1 Tax=Specibacter sp. RAF43 TaxID=3233057 RepID=UPI003F9B8BD7